MQSVIDIRLVSFFLLKAGVTDFMSSGRNVTNVSEGIGSNYNVCVRCVYVHQTLLAGVDLSLVKGKAWFVLPNNFLGSEI